MVPSAPGEMCKSEILAMNRQQWGRGCQRPDFTESLEEIRRCITASSSIAATQALLTAEADSLPHSLCTTVLEFSNNLYSVHLWNLYFASKMVWVCFFFSFAIVFFLICQES